MQNNVNRLVQAPPAYRQYATQAQQDLATFDPGKVYFLFQNGGFGILASPINCPPSVSAILDLTVPMTTNTASLALDQVPLARAVERMGASAPDEWKRLAVYQRGRVWPNTLPKLPPEDHSFYHPAVSRAAQTDWLGEQGKMEYVCDYYSHGGYSMLEAQRKLPVKRPLAVELDEMAAKRDISWKKNADGIYLVRNNRWYRDDNLEVPEPLLRRWFGALLQTRRQEAAPAMPQAGSQGASQAAPLAAPQAAPPSPEERIAAWKQRLDWAAEVFSTLTPWQMRNGLALFQPEEKDLAPQNDTTAGQDVREPEAPKSSGHRAFRLRRLRGYGPQTAILSRGRRFQRLPTYSAVLRQPGRCGTEGLAGRASARHGPQPITGRTGGLLGAVAACSHTGVSTGFDHAEIVHRLAWLCQSHFRRGSHLCAWRFRCPHQMPLKVPEYPNEGSGAFSGLSEC